MADIFSHLNEVSLSIQGPDLTIIEVAERLQAFQAKLPLWKRRLETDNFANFPMLEEVISQSRTDNTEALSPSLRGNMVENLDRLQQSFKGYCSDDLNFELWIRNPFLADLHAICDDDLGEDGLIELTTIQMLRSDFNSKNVAEFWCSLTQANPRLVKRAMVALFPLATSYLCESGFSPLLAIKKNEIGWTLRTTCVLPSVAILRGGLVWPCPPRFLPGPPFGPPVFSARNFLRKESKLPILLEKLLSFITTKKAALDCYW